MTNWREPTDRDLGPQDIYGADDAIYNSLPKVENQYFSDEKSETKHSKIFLSENKKNLPSFLLFLTFLICVSNIVVAVNSSIQLSQIKNVIDGQTSRVNAFSFSPNGKVLATTDNNNVKLWDISTGKEIKTLRDQTSGVNALSFSPSGKVLATTDNDGVKLWDITTGKRITTFSKHPNTGS